MNEKRQALLNEYHKELIQLATEYLKGTVLMSQFLDKVSIIDEEIAAFYLFHDLIDPPTGFRYPKEM